MSTVGLQWLANNEEKVRRLARRMARGRSDLEDDLFAVAVDRIDRIVELWSPEKSSLATYVVHSLGWYMYKERRKIINLRHHAPLNDEPDTSFSDLESRDWVQWFISRVQPDHARILFMKHIHGMTLAEIGRALGITKGTARNRLILAEECAAEVLRGAQ